VKVAALDLGTNSFLCLIAEVEKGHIVKVIEDHARVIRLGQGVNQTRRFHPEALNRAETCLAEFVQIINKHSVQRIEAVATSAARDVANKDEFAKILENKKIPWRVIEGETEAKLSFFGALTGRKMHGPVLVVDVGGGSTEFVQGDFHGITFTESLNIGCVRMTETLAPYLFQTPSERYGIKPPASSEVVRSMVRYASDRIRPVAKKILQHPFESVIAVAGTPTTLAGIELGTQDLSKVHGHILTQATLNKLILEISAQTPEERMARYQIEKGRADVLLAGAIILWEVLERLNKNALEVSNQGLRYGLALEMSMDKGAIK
jgi:exopolyphosphatase/guanosine-5'-triphosphate,3'-diphosphate pyrophosphatase